MGERHGMLMSARLSEFIVRRRGELGIHLHAAVVDAINQKHGRKVVS